MAVRHHVVAHDSSGPVRPATDLGLPHQWQADRSPRRVGAAKVLLGEFIRASLHEKPDRVLRVLYRLELNEVLQLPLGVASVPELRVREAEPVQNLVYGQGRILLNVLRERFTRQFRHRLVPLEGDHQRPAFLIGRARRARASDASQPWRLGDRQHHVRLHASLTVRGGHGHTGEYLAVNRTPRHVRVAFALERCPVGGGGHGECQIALHGLHGKVVLEVGRSEHDIFDGGNHCVCCLGSDHVGRQAPPPAPLVVRLQRVPR
mmetsp:Transcript_16384/g.27923  ORF Transcript_16384/g.27923 Transcript_16384/m.27923 type:complete len:262 (+) Transcript_16384:2185-2970(+)